MTVPPEHAGGTPILALNLPSGLDPDTGTPHDPTVRATRTLALALPKGSGFIPRPPST